MNSTPTVKRKKRRKRHEWERHLVYAKTGGRCFYCWDELDYIWDFVCDHFIPLSRGGLDDHSNLVPACYFCDNRKRSFMPTAILCTTLKKWKRGELVPKQYLDLPPAISAEKLTRHQRHQVKRYKQSREHQVAWEAYQKTRRCKAVHMGTIPNPVLPWHVLGNHTARLNDQKDVSPDHQRDQSVLELTVTHSGTN